MVSIKTFEYNWNIQNYHSGLRHNGVSDLPYGRSILRVDSGCSECRGEWKGLSQILITAETDWCTLMGPVIARAYTKKHFYSWNRDELTNWLLLSLSPA